MGMETSQIHFLIKMMQINPLKIIKILNRIIMTTVKKFYQQKQQIAVLQHKNQIK